MGRLSSKWALAVAVVVYAALTAAILYTHEWPKDVTEKVEWKKYTYYQPPIRRTATIRVQWYDEETARVLCDGAAGCMKGKQDEKGNWVATPLIIAPAPIDFNDHYALIIFGHEVLHVLGAYHD